MSTLTLPATFIRDRTTWLLYLLLGYYAYMVNAFGPPMPFLRAELNLSYNVASLHLSAFAFGVIVAGVFGDRLAARIGKVGTMAVGVVGMAIGAILFTLGHQREITLASAFLMGTIGALTLVMIQSLLTERHGQQSTMALTESNVIASLFATAMPLIVGFSERIGLGWRTAIWLGLAGVIPMALLLIDRTKSPIHGVDAPPLDTAPIQRGRLSALTWTYLGIVFLVVAAEFCMLFWGAELLEKLGRLSRDTAVLSMSAFFIATLIGRTVGTRLAARYPNRRLLLVALTIVAIGFPLFWIVDNAIIRIIGLFITGLGIANLYPLTLSLTMLSAGQLQASASARTAMSGGIAILLMPFLLGWFAEQVGIFAAYSVVPVLIIIAALLLALASKRSALLV